jgi:Bacterial Ig-like domain
VRLVATAVAAGLAATLLAQSAAPLDTSLAAIERYPDFFHGRTVALVATPAPVDRLWRVAVPAPRTFVIVPRTGEPPDRPVELHGVLFDVGHLSSDDSRLAQFGLTAIVTALSGDHWPDRGSFFALVNATWTDPPDPASGSLRAIVLQPGAYDGKTVTITGRFRAQNLYADLPAWPRQSRWDFILQAADASLWITGRRPRGKGFDLDPTTRRGAGTWLKVTGVVHLDGSLPRVEAEQIVPSAPVEEAPPAPVAPAPPGQPPTVVFSRPLDGETNVDPAQPVGIQFSRDMDAASFDDHVHVSYGAGATEAPPAFTVTYRPLNRSIEVRFAAPLAADTAVTVELADGITAQDGARLAPTHLSFRTKPAGGRRSPRAPSRRGVRGPAPTGPSSGPADRRSPSRAPAR